jgi:hypothetical protein
MQGVGTRIAPPQDRVSGSAHGAYLWTITHVAVHGPSPPQKNTTRMQRTVCGLLLIFGTDAGIYSHGDNTKQFVTRATGA